MTIRLACAGASGTGKSTLATAVAGALKLPICPVGSREVSKSMGFESPYDVDKAGRRSEFQQALLHAKVEWEIHHDTGFVTDRTHFDNLAYTTMHSPELARDQAFIDDVTAAMHMYTHIVICPISAFHDVAADPSRVADIAYHREYERILLDLLEKTAWFAYGRRIVLKLYIGDREQRLAHVMKLVRP
jgi:energy-coupling factor transporter ATP-binding protein EcfA2